jgi:excisionase family DNA binding protein
MDNNYCTTREAAKLLGISVRTAQLWLEKGHLKGWKTPGGHRRIMRSSLDSAARDRRYGGVASPRHSALPVLIIEDDANLLKLYRAQISRWPFDVTIYTAPNGYEGMVMVGEIEPRLLICDLRLPGVNGFVIVRSLCTMERYLDMTIVVVSGMPEGEIEAHGGVPERVELMGKPINFNRLREIAGELWAQHSEQPALASPGSGDAITA